MRVGFLNPFVEAAKEVLSADANLEIQRRYLSLEKDPVRVDEVTIPRVLVPLHSDAGTITAHLALRAVPRPVVEEAMPIPQPPGIDVDSGRLIFQNQ